MKAMPENCQEPPVNRPAACFECRRNALVVLEHARKSTLFGLRKQTISPQTGGFPTFEIALSKAVHNARQLETWPFYYKYRFAEITEAIRRAGIKKIEIALDLGCGNSFSSMLLSLVAGKVVAADLPVEDAATHSLGISTAKTFQEKVQGSALLVGAEAQKLPFKKDSFDAVSCFYVLQYIKNKRSVLREIHRLLKPGGILMLLVPNATERIYTIPRYYIHAFKWAFSRSALQKGKAVYATTQRKSVLLPPPHGNYENSFEEFIAHGKKIWLRLICEFFEIKSIYAGMAYPIDLAKELLGHAQAYSLFSKTQKFFRAAEKIFGEQNLTFAGNSLCIIAVKR